MIKAEELNQKSNIQIDCDILSAFLDFPKFKEYDSKEEFLKNKAKVLKFHEYYDYDLLRACIYQLEDSDYAIREFLTNGLYVSNPKIEEMYLRLYGILNACYLEKGVISTLVKLFNFKNQKEINAELSELKAIQLRNKIASHSTFYETKISLIYSNDNEIEKTKFDSYKVAQKSLDKFGEKLHIVGRIGGSEKFNLKETILSFNLKIESYLDSIISKELERRDFSSEVSQLLKSQYDFVKHRRL